MKNVHRFLSIKRKLGQTKLKAVSAFTCKSIEFKKNKWKKRIEAKRKDVSEYPFQFPLAELLPVSVRRVHHLPSLRRLHFFRSLSLSCSLCSKSNQIPSFNNFFLLLWFFFCFCFFLDFNLSLSLCVQSFG